MSIRLTKRSFLFSASFFILGILFSVYVFAVDVQLLAIPYKYKVRMLKKDIELICRGKVVTLPAGSEIVLRKEYKQHREYILIIREDVVSPFNNDWYADVDFSYKSMCDMNKVLE